jgi:hypothetical protein
MFYILVGITVPTFNDFWYYFNLNVVEISLSFNSFLSLLSNICLFLGVIVYRKYLIHSEVRTLIKFAIGMFLVAGVMGLIYSLRWNLKLGISDITMLVMMNSGDETVMYSCYFIPTVALFAKLTPNHIEASVFAFLAGIYNFARAFL